MNDNPALYGMVFDNVERVAELGDWPDYIEASSMLKRIPTNNGTAPGFDAGIACALDLIPRDKQKLAATLHANYSEEAVEQIRHESGLNDPDSETTWWAAACFFCKEGTVNISDFADQVRSFMDIAGSSTLRLEAAQSELAHMARRYKLVDGVPFVIEDGGLQGAYVAGHEWGVQYIAAHGLFFIGTFRQSLGLEDFAFSDRTDAKGLAMSGPVHGSQKFVKVSSFDELARAVEAVKKHLG